MKKSSAEDERCIARSVPASDERQKTVRVLICMLDNRFGGPHRRSECVARRLRDHGIDTIFLLAEKTKDLVPLESFECILLENMQFLRRGRMLYGLFDFAVRLPSTLRRVRRILHDRNIDVVHINGLINIVPALAARSAGLPIIWHLNDTHTPTVVRRTLLMLVRRFADMVIVQGEDAGRRCLGTSRTLWQKTEIVYPAVDVQRFSMKRFAHDAIQHMRAELGADDSCILVGTVANLNPYKGHTFFIEAARLLKQQFDRVRFVVVGRKIDTHREYARHIGDLIVETGMQNDVVLTGFKRDVEDVLAALDIFVLASTAESCPNAVLEAMAMEIPIAATDVGSMRGIIDDGQQGLIVPPADAPALADAIAQIIHSTPQERTEMGRKGRRRVEERFALDKVSDQHLSIYETVLRNRTASPRKAPDE